MDFAGPDGYGRRASAAVRALPLVVLAGAVAAIVAASPGGHYGLLLAAVPLLAATVHSVFATALIGLVTVGTYAALRQWIDEDSTDIWLIKLGFVTVAAVLAVLISQALARERKLTQSRDIALALQRGLLPHDIPRTNAAEISYRYTPADTAAGVGGDWFDVIPLPGARVALVMGDVVGHGLHAAATMGRLRTAVQTLAALDLPPEEVLARIDTLVGRMSDGDAAYEPGGSCLYMVYDPVTGSCTTANAGHTPPALVVPDGGVEFHPQAQNPPLGFGTAVFDTTTSTLPEGTLIALYTDGFLDLRRQETDEAISTLARALLPAGRPLEDICDGVYATLPVGHDDDAALLLARTRALNPGDVATWVFHGSPEDVPAACTDVAVQLDAWGLDEQVFTAELVVSELLTNAIRYADPPFTVRLIKDAALICEVTDASSTAPHLRHAEPLDEGGRGLYLVRRITDRWGTRYTEDGKTIWAEIDLT